MIVMLAVLLVVLALLGISFFELSKIWMILGIVLAAASVVLLIFYQMFLKKKGKEKLVTGIRIGLLTLSVLCLVAAGTVTVDGGYGDYQASMDAIMKAYEAGDSKKADSLMLEFLDADKKKEKEEKTEKILSTDDFISKVKSAELTAEQRDELLSAKAGYLYGQDQADEMKTVLDAVTDKKAERYYGLSIAYLYSKYPSEDQEETLYQELAKVYDEAADQYPDNYSFQLGAGLTNIETENYNRAEIYLEKARALTSDPVVVDLARTVLLFRSGNVEQAKLFLEDVKTMVANGYGPSDIQEGISEVQGWLDEADAQNAAVQ